MSDLNTMIVRRWCDEMWTSGRLDVVGELFAEDAVDHDALPGQPPGSEGFAHTVKVFRDALPDLRVTAEDIVSDGDRVAVRWTARGTHRGEVMGIAATDRTVSLKGIDVLRIADGKIVERWGEWDATGFIAQLQSDAT